MMCARREAAAHRPAASSPPHSPSSRQAPPEGRSRTDPRGGRARRSLLLPVLALLLGALGLFVAAPAQAQSSEIWSATLRVDAFGNGAGCDSDIETCSSRLSPNAFVYKGPTYTIQGLLYFYTGQLRLRLSGRTAAQTKSDLNPLTLVVGGTQKFKVKDAGTLGTTYITWSMSNPNWSEGQQVSMKLLSLPKKPTGLSAQAGDRQVTLRWNNPNDKAITKYQVYVSEDGAAGSWSDISGSGAATTSHTVTDLKIGTIYSFYIRAVNALGNSPRSDKVQVKVLPLDLSSDNTLSGLSATSATSATGPFSALALSPTFSATRTSYTATVPHATMHVKLTPAANEANAAAATYKGSVAPANAVLTELSGTTAAIALDVGDNAITVQVTAQDSSTRDYTVTITRQARTAPPPPPQGSIWSATLTADEDISGNLTLYGCDSTSGFQA